MSQTESEIIREPERHRKTQISRTQWWRKEREGLAPKRLRLGANSIGWLKHEIDAWIAERAAARP